jgi:iron complex transport system substrate-binding protein
VRIVSLIPSATEIVYALGAQDALVGVTHECDFPLDARMKPVLTSSALPHAASSAAIDRHVRASLHAGSSLYHLDGGLLERCAPDVIITQETCEVCAVSYEIVARAAKRLRGDPRILSLEPSSLEDLYANIATVGALCDAGDAAARVVAGSRGRAGAVAAAVAGRARPRTLVLEWTDPPIGPGHWTPELVALAGGEPVLASAHDARVLTWAEIVAADPDAVIVVPCGFDLAATQRAIAELGGNPAWGELRAVREGRAYAVDGNAYVNRPGPRLIDSAEIFATILHGVDSPAGREPAAWSPIVTEARYIP